MVVWVKLPLYWKKEKHQQQILKLVCFHSYFICKHFINLCLVISCFPPTSHACPYSPNSQLSMAPPKVTIKFCKKLKYFFQYFQVFWYMKTWISSILPKLHDHFYHGLLPEGQTHGHGASFLMRGYQKYKRLGENWLEQTAAGVE